jgi:hypothetical protein
MLLPIVEILGEGPAAVEEAVEVSHTRCKCGVDMQTLSDTDQYLLDSVRDVIWHRNAFTFPNDKEWERNQKWLIAPDPQGHDDPVRYLTYGCHNKEEESGGGPVVKKDRNNNHS